MIWIETAAAGRCNRSTLSEQWGETMHITHYEFQSLLRTMRSISDGVQRIERKVDSIMSKASQLADLATSIVSVVETLESEVDELVADAKAAHNDDDDATFNAAMDKLSKLGASVAAKAADTRQQIDSIGAGVVTSAGSVPPSSAVSGDPAATPRSGGDASSSEVPPKTGEDGDDGSGPDGAS